MIEYDYGYLREPLWSDAFTKLVTEVESEDAEIKITRQGEPVAVMVSPARYERLMEALNG